MFDYNVNLIASAGSVEIRP